jgi:hypothetical protein
MPPKHRVTVTKEGNSAEFLARLKTVGNLATYVGIPASSTRGRTAALLKKAKKSTSKRKQRLSVKKMILSLVESNDMNNATLLYIFSRGSSLNNQPPRPVIEPALEAYREDISAKIAKAVAAYADGRIYESKILLASAGAFAAKVARDWFTDSENGWAANTESTLRGKYGDQPGIMTGIMRAAITHTEKEVENV